MTLAASLMNPSIKIILSTFLNVDDREVARIPMQGPFILATNHINTLDAPVGFSHLHPRPLTAFVKVETWKHPLLGPLFNAWNTIPIHRGEVDFDAFKKAEEALHNKKIVIVAPEGTRSYHGKLNMGYPGIVLLAFRTRVPILPVVFYGNENFKSKFHLFRRTNMVIKVGEPFQLKFDSNNIPKEIRQQMVDEIMYEIARLLPESNRGVYSDLSRSKQQYLDFISH